MSYTAIVLAGSRPGRDAFAESFGTDLKALIPVAGEPMVRRPVRALLVGRPDSGLVLVAWWTIVSLIFHAVRLAQASEQAARGKPILSWLS